MEKLIAKFKETRTEQAAKRVVNHAGKHPMSVCVLAGEELELFNAAKYMAG